MPKLFLKDEKIETAPPIVGYRMLEYMKKGSLDSVSIFDLAYAFKNEQWFSPKTLYYGMIFLFSTGLIDFQEPYLKKNASN